MSIILRSCFEVPIKMAKGISRYIYDSTKGNYLGRNVKVSSVTVKNKIAYFPRNSAKFKDIYGIIPYKDKRTKVELVTKDAALNNTFSFREYQKQPVKELILNFKKGNSDILFSCDTGFGKTFLIPHIIISLQQKTLIITDRVLLNEQMFKSITSNSNLKTTLLSLDTDVESFDVCITTFQFLHKNISILTTLANAFGLLILDEVHIVGAATYLEAVHSINSFYRLGLSATPTRSDGLTDIITDTIEHKVLGINPNKLVPEVKMLQTALSVSMADNNFKRSVGIFLRTALVHNFVLYYIKMLVAKKRKILLVIDEKATQVFYSDLLSANKIKTKVINSTTKNKLEIFEGIENDFVDVIIGCKVMEKGVDIPILDTLLFLYGNSTKEALEQFIGRISREHKNKSKPLVIDFMFGGILQKSADARYSTYLSLQKVHKVTANYFYINTKNIKKLGENYEYH